MLTSQRAAAGTIADKAERRLSLLAGTIFVPIGLHLPYFPVWLAARGLSDTAIAAAFATPFLIRLGLTPLVSAIADKRGIAATLAACTILTAFGYATLIGLHDGAAIFVVAVALMSVQGSLAPLVDALILSEIRRIENAGLRRLDYGRIRVFTSLSVLVMMLLSGTLVRLLPGELIILALAAIALLPVATSLFVAAHTRKVRPGAQATSGLIADKAQALLVILCILGAALVQASHAELYTFATLHWRAIGLAPDFIGVTWATGVACEAVTFFVAGRFLGGGRNAIAFIILGAAGAILRWSVMALDPPPALLPGLQAMHALSYAASYVGCVLFIGDLAGPNHRARMQGWLATATALSMAVSTFVCGRLTLLYGEKAYLAMAGLAGAGLVLTVTAGAMKARLPPKRP